MKILKVPLMKDFELAADPAEGLLPQLAGGLAVALGHAVVPGVALPQDNVPVDRCPGGRVDEELGESAGLAPAAVELADVVNALAGDHRHAIEKHESLRNVDLVAHLAHRREVAQVGEHFLGLGRREFGVL